MPVETEVIDEVVESNVPEIPQVKSEYDDSAAFLPDENDERFDKSMSDLKKEPVTDTGTSKEDAVKIPDELITKAKELGLSDYGLSKFDSQKELERFIDIRENEILDSGRRALANQNGSVDESPPLAVIPPQIPVTPAEIAEMFKLTFKDPEMVDEELRNNLNGMSEHNAKLFQSQSKKLTDAVNKITEMESVLNATTRMYQEREYEKFDKNINSLPKEYKEFVGEGDLYDLLNNPKMAEVKKIRDAIWDTREVLLLGYKNMKLPPPSDKLLFKKAVDVVLADKKEQIIKNSIKEKAKSREHQIIGRPSNRNTEDSLTPIERAAKRFDEGRNKIMSVNDDERL